MRRWLPALALWVALGPAVEASAFEALDGRLEVHGFVEMQLRGISQDFSQQMDLTQWYNILNVELELGVLEEPLGPVDMIDLYIRAEARYDCIYTRGCGLFPSANSWGNRAKDLPGRLADSYEVDTTGAMFRGNRRLRSGNRGRVVPLSVVDQFDTLAVINRAAFDYVFQNNLPFRYTQLQQETGKEFGFAPRRLGPWLPKNFINTNADLADRANPFDAGSVYPVTGLGGSGALPFRPIPVTAPSARGSATTTARGIYTPTAALQGQINAGNLDSFDFNFSQSERAWNRGASQQQTKELKEAYLDIEMFDARLWMRLGRQSIVWGKTELFRTTDQFNPADLALASLPSLEEARVPLWAARFVYSFYEVGPLSDVRAEFAFNFDEFQGNDLGACGEPYTPNPVCELTFGGVGHGLTGAGVAGTDRPPNPWDDIKGFEIGGRIEWRWERFSFALTDFWGFADQPHLEQIGWYERNVDPATGIPRPQYQRSGPRGSCTATLVGVQYQFNGNCLQPGPTQRTTAVPGSANPTFTDANGNVIQYTAGNTLGNPNNALQSHHANQQIFAMICGTSIGFTALDPTACAQNVFGSSQVAAGITTIGEVLGGMIAGNPAIHQTFSGVLGIVGAPLAYLTDDSLILGSPLASREFVPGAALGSPEGVPVNLPLFGKSLSALLTPEQEALLGCGPWWRTNCDTDGIDILNADASTLLQSFVGFEGTGPSPNVLIPLGAGGAPVGPPQPGHTNYAGGPVCTTGDIRNDGRNDQLPGCRSPGTPGYQQNVDGSATLSGYVAPPALAAMNAFIPYQCASLLGGGCAATPALGNRNPLHGQPFASEMAVASWNFMMLLVANSAEFNGTTIAGAFDTTPGTCSYRQPQYCSVVQNLFNVAGVKRNTPRAGGNYQFGRRTFFWHAGTEVLESYERRNVLGFSADFAEDTTKSNWSIEATWINNTVLANNNSDTGTSEVQEWNLTISADRPTFINFLNQNRTFLFNTQWFFQYLQGYEKGIQKNGPFNVLFTFAVQTGYAQDRLLPKLTFVYDINSKSGGLLPSVEYRYSSDFSVILGVNYFWGNEELRDMPVREIGVPLSRGGTIAYQDQVENGLAVVRDRDEIFARIRYTF